MKNIENTRCFKLKYQFLLSFSDSHSYTTYSLSRYSAITILQAKYSYDIMKQSK